MYNRRIILMLILVLTSLGFTACQSDSGTTTEAQEATEMQTEEVAEVQTEDATEKQTEEETEVQTEQETKVQTEEKIEEETESVVADENGKWADLNNRVFYVNGQKFTLGESTLQDMIDAGVPFNSDDIASSENNVKPNSESAPYKIEIAEYHTGQVQVGNFTEENAKANELPITYVYLPLQDEPQQVLTFNFPEDITIEQLKENSGEPTDEKHFEGDNDFTSDTLEYKQESEKYIGESGYSFEFQKGKLKYITINLK